MISGFEPFHRRSFSTALRRVALGFALAATSAASLAHGAEPDPQTRTIARELARRGAEAFEQDDFATALDRFTRAEALFRAPSICVMRARSLVGLGRLVEALDAYEATQRMPLADDAPSAFREAVRDAKREGEELRAKIPHLLLHVRIEPADADGVTVVLDGNELPRALLEVERPIDPGLHEIHASAPSRPSIATSVSLHEGDHLSLELPFETLAIVSPAEPHAETAPPGASPPRSSGSRPIWGWTLIGAGAAGLGLAAITGEIALTKKSSLDAQCHPGCPPSAASDMDAFRSNRTLSYVSLALGTASLGAGGYLLLFAGKPSAAHVAASVEPFAVHVHGAF
jgi:hypothetical protein